MDLYPYPSTGFVDLDSKLNHLQLGDNVVWQVDDVEDYKSFVTPFVNRAIEQRRKLIYIRFATHSPLLEEMDGLEIIRLDPAEGFEGFSSQVHNIIAEKGYEAFYVFDCLSYLLSAWATDLMIGNFFMVTCPYLFELETIAYFGIIRDRHSFKTVARIRETTQLLLDLYRIDESFYIHPLKVWNRYSPTMFLPHKKVGDDFKPVSSSYDSSRLFSYISSEERKKAERNIDHWDKLFLDAQDMLESSASMKEIDEIFEQIIKLMISKDKRIKSLAKQYFTLQDLLNIKARLIGTGYIGGKAVGMLLARNILLNDKGYNWSSKLEAHDSFYIGSDVFYSYIVQNRDWKLRMEQKTQEGYFAKSGELRDHLLNGRFPAEIREQFQEMIEYYGQSPIIVRSSSLLEDSFGNAFAGKYESIFLVNQGSPEERYRQFENAVRRIYASTMSYDALSYRLRRGLDRLDEQMALLVQRVSGSYHGESFFPDVAGVGVSYNTFVWNEKLDPTAGMVRIVMGLGTRAVDRVEDDYPRTAALDNPLLRPHTTLENLKQFSQRQVDTLNVVRNEFETVPLSSLTSKDIDLSLDLIATEDKEASARMKQLGISGNKMWVLTFDEFLSNTDFVPDMRRMLTSLESAYDFPVDLEFALKFSQELGPQVNLLQCRPLQTKGIEKRAELPKNVDYDKLFFKSKGSFMGGNVSLDIDRVIYVDPENYIKLPINKKYDIARLIGRINHIIEEKGEANTIIMGPGRWGTTTPSLGVPVVFSEISKVCAMCEISYPGGNLMPELSYGSHFFQDLVESDIFYVALFVEHGGVVLNMDALKHNRNLLSKLMPEASKYNNVVKVYNVKKESLRLVSDVVAQDVICYKE